MIKRRAGFLVTALFFVALLGAGLLYDDLSAGAQDDVYRKVRQLNEVVTQVSQKYVDEIPPKMTLMSGRSSLMRWATARLP